MNKLKVAHICEAFSVLSETFIYDYILGTNKLAECSVYTFSKQNESSRPFERVMELKLPPVWHYSRVIEKIKKIVGGSYHNLYFAWPYFASQLVEKFKETPPSVMHAHFGPTGVFASEIAKKLNLPLIVTFYGYDCSVLLKEASWVKKYQEMYRVAKFITVLSEKMKDKIIKQGCPSDKVKVIHLAKNIADYPFVKRKPPVQNLITVGRLVEKKGITDAINAINIATQLGANVKLTVIGGGPLFENLNNLVSELNIRSRVNILGALSHQQVKEHFNKSDAFILCSKTGPDGDEEGTPTVLMEAQALGLPCISTYHSGIPETIPQIGGKLLAREGNVQDIAEKILMVNRLSETEILEISEQGRRKMESEFNLEIECKKLFNLYQDSTTL